MFITTMLYEFVGWR